MIGFCALCGIVFRFNPRKVPTIRIGEGREPLCRSCVERINQERVKHNLDPYPISEDAYWPLNDELLGGVNDEVD